MPAAPAPANFTVLQECRWVSPKVSISPGDALRTGKPVEFSSGHASIRFASGAEATLIGPCIFEVKSGNSGFLTLGRLKARAEGPVAKGFTITTGTARVVDAGTEFVAAAAPDGQSRVDVTSGEVTVHLEGVKEPHRLRQGDALSVEAGSSQVLVRIESGDGTAAFKFPTIEPPSDHDYADQASHHASIRLVRGSLHRSGPIPSGPVDRLLDGRGQSQADSPAESVFIDDDGDGALLLDLEQTVAISRINTYSWHEQKGREPQNRVRAVQKYTLYGYCGEAPPSIEGNHEEVGWTRIARVDSDNFLQITRPIDRPAQQACSISGRAGLSGAFAFYFGSWSLRTGPINSGCTIPSPRSSTFTTSSRRGEAWITEGG